MSAKLTSGAILPDLAHADLSHFSRFSKEYTAASDPTNNFLLDYSKSRITQPIFVTLFNLIRKASVEQVHGKTLSMALAPPPRRKALCCPLRTKEKVVNVFDIAKENMFGFWDWVGGCYSFWSAIGLSITLVIGYEHYEARLCGAHDIDAHFLTAPLEKNLPVLLAVIGLWYNNLYFYSARSGIPLLFLWLNHVRAAPYDQHTHKCADYLHSCDMKSSGKVITKGSKRVDYQTILVIWSVASTNGQHSFYQLLHQGTNIVPADFLAPGMSHNPLRGSLHRRILLSNYFVQSKALVFGKTEEQVCREVGSGANEALMKSKVVEGNRPSNSIFFPLLRPATLAHLCASFDGWVHMCKMGIELGKVLAKIILAQPEKPADVKGHDSSSSLSAVSRQLSCADDWPYSLLQKHRKEYEAGCNDSTENEAEAERRMPFS
ncbi:hypothetical protein HETIRDRAFT_446210 [Heterobasidion irregulare TC 32-1]|uniref:Glucose-6-phosphate isomerase n=1 Tax=Heterobasidion irregulare (strain TC 32-1) TaxID=747525 RepID=W4JVB3_HETIT|nr:uncharacterized protein HETIRDRAFT_446210 [Heterobasidion irregulare TC 32-1]ETW77020.1 hypothetical protein HETIRDRAFT_446210 [Heterobasidion irregulare TC 32-1]